MKDCSVEGGLVKNGHIERIGRISHEDGTANEGREVHIPLEDKPNDLRITKESTDPAKPSSTPGSIRAVFVPRDDIPNWTY